MIPQPYTDPTKMDPHRATNSEPINLQSLKETCGPDGAQELLQIFLDSTMVLFQRMNGAQDNKDSKALKAAAHEMKGACGSIGANKMAAISRSMEAAALAEDWTLCSNLIAELQTSFLSVKKFCEDALCAEG
jgi:HPt (histidine-containing phosphotransfer) domain-containing protein